MENTIAIQLYSLFIFTISGVAISVFFDVFRILRKSFKTPDIITYIEDIIFWIFTGVFFLFILFKFNNGEIRNYVVLGIILGILIYMFTISKYFIKTSIIIIDFIKKIISYPIKFIFSIFKKILKPFTFIIINVRKNISYYYIKIKNMTKKNKKVKKRITKKKDFNKKCRKI